MTGVRIVGIVVGVAMLCSSADALAGTYRVTGCRTGWTPDIRNTEGALFGPSAFDQCVEPNYQWLYASLGPGPVNGGDYAGWRFDAPPDTSIVSATLTWLGLGVPSASNSGASQVGIVASNSAQPIERFYRFQGSDTFSFPDAQWIRAYVACQAILASAPTCANPVPDSPETAFVGIRRSSVTLLDRSAPEVQQAAGPALSEPVWTGAEPLSYRAEDRGGGLYRIVVEVDGATVVALPATSDERCVDQTGARDFAYPTPCPNRGAGSVQVDAGQLPGGQHVVALYLEDVAGNRTALLAPTRLTILNDYRTVGYYAAGRYFNPRLATPRVANGDGATDGAKLTATFVRRIGKGRSRHTVERSTREVRYSQRPTVRGTLSAPSGEPIRNATIFIGQRPEGQEWRLDGAVRTNTQGRFVYRPPARRSNRHLRAVYFPFSDSNENVTSSVLKLGVRAGMTLHVNRHRLRNGDRLVFTGRVLGPVPAAGVAVTLQAKVGRHYRSFRQLRATSRHKGHIRTVYRFERTTQPARYRFRLKVVRQAGLPFQSGVSPVVSVAVRP
jgi:hypothetical protein